MFGPHGATRAGEGVPRAELLRAILPHNADFQRCQPDNESEAEIVPAAEGLQGRLGRCR